MSEDGVLLVQGAKAKYVDNPQVDRILQNAETVSASAAKGVPQLLEKDVPALLGKTRSAVEGVDKIVSVFSSPEELARFKVILANIDATTQSAKLAVGDAQVVASHVRKGNGSVGALVMDEQLFDDLQELARDLKHNPWKFFWKE